MSDRDSRPGPARPTRDRALPDQRAGSDEPGREAWELLVGLFPGIRSNFLAACAQLELTPAQGRLLQYLDPEHPVPMTELACVHSCDASNITGLVDKLEARSLIERTPNPRDRRVKMIAVTSAGGELRDRLLERISQPPAFITSLLPSEQRTLRDLLRRATKGAASAG
jgi:DNA-binding MarR family transcriptional regulator